MTDTSTSQSTARTGFRFLVVNHVVGALITAFAGPVAAQGGGGGGSGSNVGFCDIQLLPGLIEMVFQLLLTAGLVVTLLTWVATSFTETLPISSKRKEEIRRQRNSSIAAYGRLLIVPIVVIALVDGLAIGIPDCIDIIPFL